MKMVDIKEEKLMQMQNCYSSDNKLLKPFVFGWKREVVNRSVISNRNPNCDIYYFSPSGKKIRSLIEVKSHLTDGLTSDCFSFKRQPLGFNEDFETIRNARAKQREKNLSNYITKSLRIKKTRDSLEIVENEKNVIKNSKKIKLTKSKKNFKNNDESITNYKKENDTEKLDWTVDKKFTVSFTIKNKIGKASDKMEFISKTTKNQKSNKIKSVKKNMKQNSEKEKVLKEKFTANEKMLKKTTKKSVSSIKLLQKKVEKGSINKKKKNLYNKNYKYLSKFPQDNKESVTYKEVINSNENNKNHVVRDLKSIVKKNIGKYREMREKQKLKSVSLLMDKNRNKLGTKSKNRTKSESIAKNRHLYLKPFQKGWKRELVFRRNCANPGQQADVYYFHPNGKKLRSCREVAENLTRGLTIEYFTFRKEPIGCGEPLEIIRSARSHVKSLLQT